ncbi:MAG: hypothetical protein ACRC57_10520 [Sarcina sp.]
MLILQTYGLQFLLIIIILIILRKRTYHKGLWEKILFWTILIAATLCAGIIILIALAATAIAPSFVQG